MSHVPSCSFGEKNDKIQRVQSCWWQCQRSAIDANAASALGSKIVTGEVVLSMHFTTPSVRMNIIRTGAPLWGKEKDQTTHPRYSKKTLIISSMLTHYRVAATDCWHPASMSKMLPYSTRVILSYAALPSTLHKIKWRLLIPQSHSDWTTQALVNAKVGNNLLGGDDQMSAAQTFSCRR